VDGSSLKHFSGHFTGKQSPVQLFWHSFDLALNRFSSRRASLPEEADPVTREAYSHEVIYSQEVISFRFWPGDRELREPAFYSYTAPRAPSPHRASAGRGGASWQVGGTALLTYGTVRQSASPVETLLEFLHNAYLAAVRGRRAGT
jgi:hypothetical protein